MRKILLAVSMAAVSSFAFAASPGGVQANATTYQENNGGVNITGNTSINASASGTTTMATGGSIARSSTGSIRAGTNITGNTSISAHSSDTTTMAEGGSIATTSVGTIGGQ